MKKVFFGLCVALCLLFSVAGSVRADDGNGHDAGYICVETETVVCPPSSEVPPLPGETSGSSNNAEAAENNGAAADALSALHEMIIALLP